LQCVAVCYSVLQCVAVCCSVLQCVAVCCSVLQCAFIKLTHSHNTGGGCHGAKGVVVVATTKQQQFNVDMVWLLAAMVLFLFFSSLLPLRFPCAYMSENS